MGNAEYMGITKQHRASTHNAEMSTKAKKPSGKTQRSAIADVVAREYTIHLHKRPRRYLQEACTKSHQGDQGIRHQVNGHHRCSSRSPIEQEGLGGRYQGRSIQTPCPHLEKA